MKRAWFCFVIVLGLTACGDDTGGEFRSSSAYFVDIAEDVGLKFFSSHGGDGRRLFFEISAGGVALFDADNDGDMDVYLINGALTSESPTEAKLKNGFFLNDGRGHFLDDTLKSGLGDEGYGCGCAIGDIDNDGDLDVFITNFGQDELYRNEGNGTFVRITDLSNWGEELWSSSAAFLDYDLDGDLDLYVCHYVDYDGKNPPRCLATDGLQEYCNPGDFQGVRDTLYQNDGSGVFVDVSEQAGIDDTEGRAFGVTVADFDDDGDPDLYVANDQNRNNLYQNNGDGTFTDIGLYSGVGYGDTGTAEAGMGCDFGDFDGDLMLDLVVTNFSGETNSLYHALGNDLFADETSIRGVATPTTHPLAFGTRFFDMDLDGDLDLFFACGHVLDTIERYGNGETFAQKDLLLENRDGQFSDISSQSGPAFKQARVGRGAAFGDIDNDGDVDIVVTHMNDKVSLYRNDSPSENASLTLDLRDSYGAPAYGARVIATIGEKKLRRDVQSAASFQSANDPRLVLGLGDSRSISELSIRWADGSEETYTSLEGGAVIKIQQGERGMKRLEFAER